MLIQHTSSQTPRGLTGLFADNHVVDVLVEGAITECKTPEVLAVIHCIQLCSFD